MKKLLHGKKGEKHLLLGNEAIARGAFEAGVKFVSCYPGTPSSEVADTIYSLREGHDKDFYIEYSVNEKVAMEIACGAAIAGASSLVTMKHVGLNVAADPLFTASYIGMPGGLVILSADDPGCHSSQNEQDNRHYARFAGLPCLEPSNAQEALEMTRAAFAMARELEQPVLLRTTTRINHVRGAVSFGDIEEKSCADFRKDPSRFVPVPQNARTRHHVQTEQLRKAAEMAETSPFNKCVIRGKQEDNNKKMGIICSGSARNYVMDSLELEGLKDKISCLELGQTWPLPERLIINFIANMDMVLIMEEGEALLERDIRALAQKNGLKAEISGKDQFLDEFGEYSTKKVLDRIKRWLGIREKELPYTKSRQFPGRPPNLCPGCAHRSVYYAVRKVFGDEAIYSSDIGCYTLGILPPLRTADFLVCMGSSITAGAGFAKVSNKPVVAFIGDSTFFHSGLGGIANAIFNRHNLLLVILDNGTTAMTGHQPNPGMVQDRLHTQCAHLEMEKILSGLGVEHMAIVRSHNLNKLCQALEDLRDKTGVRVLIAREPCLLYAKHQLGKRSSVSAYVKTQGESAERCARELACPAFTRKEGKLEIDPRLCGACMLCVQIAPESFAVKKPGKIS